MVLAVHIRTYMLPKNVAAPLLDPFFIGLEYSFAE